MNIGAPVHEVYSFWRQFDNLPRVLTHVREVRELGNGRSHWVADGVPGVPVEWQAEITEDVPDRRLSWKSLEDSQIWNEGSVHFEPQSENATRISIHLAYVPPAGKLGHALVTILGSNPKQQMDDDLMRLKSMLEEGKTTGRQGRVTAEQPLTQS